MIIYDCKHVNSYLPIDVFGVLTRRVGPKIVGLSNSRDAHRNYPEGNTSGVVDGCAFNS
jgi:hypothetical protein